MQFDLLAASSSVHSCRRSANACMSLMTSTVTDDRGVALTAPADELGAGSPVVTDARGASTVAADKGGEASPVVIDELGAGSPVVIDELGASTVTADERGEDSPVV